MQQSQQCQLQQHVQSIAVGATQETLGSTYTMLPNAQGKGLSMSCSRRAHKWCLFPTAFPPKYYLTQQLTVCLELEGVLEKKTNRNFYSYQKVPTWKLKVFQVKRDLHKQTCCFVAKFNPCWCSADLRVGPADHEIATAAQGRGRTEGASSGVGHQQHAVLNISVETST